MPHGGAHGGQVRKLALQRDTGARGLRSIIESVMLDIQYELPDLEKKGKFVVTEEVVMGLKPLFEKVDLPSEATLPNETKLSA